MSSGAGITDGGEDLNQLVLQWLPYSKKPKKIRDGDVIWHDKCIECKDGSMNQVRPLLYIPIVFRKDNIIYVIPANDIVLFAITRNRGQHSEMAMEDCVLPISNKWIKKFEIKNQTQKGLQKAILSAFRKADKDEKVKNYCEDFRVNQLPMFMEIYRKKQKEYNIV